MILFVDDEKRRIETYAECCEDAGYDVKILSGVDEAWRFLGENSQDIKLLVLDVMMPTGDRYEQAADSLGGIRTGLSFFRDVRSRYPKLPIIVLTQSSDREVDGTVGGDDRASLYRKQNVLPTELPDIIKKQLRVGGKG